jgi:putative restriction endonuclease
MGKPVGLEAAHIKWHQIGGPDSINNGIALCALHHKLFDYGAFTLDENYRIKVSQLVTGKKGMEKWLYDYIDDPISLPKKEDYYPDHSYRDWHTKEVFKKYKV